MRNGKADTLPAYVRLPRPPLYVQGVLTLVPFELEHQDVVLRWRNSPEIARFMYRDEPIDIKEHQAWFSSAISDHEDRIHRLALIHSAPSGVMSLTHIDRVSGVGEWGGYLAPHVIRGAGHGRRLLESSMAFARDEVGLRRLVVEVLEINQSALGLYRSMGFIEETRMSRAVVRDGQQVDALRLTVRL